MKFLSLCSGIEAASVAWHPLGFECIGVAEIEPFPCAVLDHHYPTVTNFGDISKFEEWPEEMFADVDTIVGGPPCQSFSIAGLRKGLNDDRGNLTLTYVRIIDHADRIRIRAGKPPVICVYENVPGLLSDKTNAFGNLLGGLAGEDVPLEPAGKRWTDAGCVFGPKRAIAWRIQDAQYHQLAQRRRRVFLVSSARDGFDPAAVLLEFEGVRRDTPPRRETGKGFTHSIAPSLTSSGRGVERGGDTRGQDPVVAVMEDPVPPLMARSSRGGAQTLSPGHQTDGHMVAVEQPYTVANCLTARMHKGINTTLDEGQTPVVTHSLRAEGFDASEDGTGRGTPLVPVTVGSLTSGHGGSAGHQYRQKGNEDCLVPVAIPFDTTQITSPANYSKPKDGDPCHPLAAGAHAPAVAYSIMPQNSGKDYKAREVEVAQPIMAGGPVGGNQGGDYILQPVFAQEVADPITANEQKTYTHEGANNFRTRNVIAFSAKDHGADATENLSPTLRAMPHDASHANGGGQMAVAIPVQEVGKRTGTSTTDPRAGIGIGEDGDPMYTLQAGAQHGVAYPLDLRNAGRNPDKRDEQNRQGLGLGEDGDPSPTISTAFVPGVAAYAFQPRIARNGRGGMGDVVNALNAQSGETGKGDAAPCVAVSNKPMDPYLGGDVTIAIDASYAKGAGGTSVAERPVVEHNMAVRRLTPAETGRLQGFPTSVELDFESMTRDEAMIICLMNGDISVNPETGEVFGHRGPGGYRLETPKVIGHDHPSGYREVKITANGVKKVVRVNRLVWISVNGPIPDGMVIDHINNDKHDNRISNLQCVTTAENNSKAHEDGLIDYDNSDATKLTAEVRTKLFHEYIQTGLSYRELAVKYGITYGRVGQIVRELNYTQIPWRGKPAEDCPDGPQYKAHGNSMAVPVMRWIGARIARHLRGEI